MQSLEAFLVLSGCSRCQEMMEMAQICPNRVHESAAFPSTLIFFKPFSSSAQTDSKRPAPANPSKSSPLPFKSHGTAKSHPTFQVDYDIWIVSWSSTCFVSYQMYNSPHAVPSTAVLGAIRTENEAMLSMQGHLSCAGFSELTRFPQKHKPIASRKHSTITTFTNV